MSGKSNVSMLILHMQKYKSVDFLCTDVHNSNKYPHYHSVLSRQLDAFIKQPFSKKLYV